MRKLFLLLPLAALLAAPARALGPNRPRHSPPAKPRRYPQKKAPTKRTASPQRTEAGKAKPAPVGRISRGEMKVLIKAKGTVRAEDIFRLKSAIEGRVEQVIARPRKWFAAKSPLVKILEKSYAALMDSKVTTPYAVMEDRWRPVYRPTPAHCRSECFVLKVYARPKKLVKPETLLIEAARKLRLIGRIRPGDGKWIKKGQLLSYWDAGNPRKKIQGRVEHFIFDTQGERVEPGGTITVLLDSKHYLDPGTQWNGVITVLAKKKVLRVPTSALITFEGATYLPVRVSTGITTYDYTEITSGASDRHQFLYLDQTGKTGKTTSVETHEPPPAYLFESKPRVHNRRSTEFEPARPRRRKKRWEAPKIDVFPGDIPEDENERFPSDL